MQIRLADISDLEVMKRIEDACFSEDGLSERMSTLRNRLIAFPRGVVVAVFDGAVIGYASAERRNRITKPSLNNDARRTHSADSKYLYLATLAVDPGHRNHGVGRTLLSYEFDLASSLGCSAITLVTDHAPKYYERFAFRTHKMMTGTHIMLREL